MDKIPYEIRQIIFDYIKDLQKEISVDKIIIFGSYAKGTFTKDSDIDIAIFSKNFEDKRRIEAIDYLLEKALKYLSIDLEPIGYGYSEYEKQENPFIKEIISTGIEMKVA